ncbi:Unknown protein [Striga hermonthica]|uniref:Protein farnesyltransferase/geranylgeranyltransferase type-1 subunit alpha n=1 Tax=Striga hermonthica TaxID=68872 RepID=A0A9N7RAW7_STRHE|nr:Unknown protein [Striga hermonthica]
MRQTASRRREDELPKGVLAALRLKALPPNIVDRKHVARPFQSRRAPPAESELTNDTELESPYDFRLQLESYEHLIKSNPNDPKLWQRRKKFIGSRIDAARVFSELHFTKEFLCIHPKSLHCWSYRKWLLEAFHAGMGKIEFSDVEFELKGRTHNKFAWCERTFLVTKLRMRSGEEESDYAIEAIKKEPENGLPWIYLRVLYKTLGFDQKKLDELFEFVLSPDCAHEWGRKGEYIYIQKIYSFFLETHISLNRGKYINAIDAILDLICFGYRLPSNRTLNDNIMSCDPHRQPCSNVLDCFEHVLSIANGLRITYWKGRIDQARLALASDNAQDKDKDKDEDEDEE